MNEMNFLTVSPDIIKEQLRNLSQIVFEVTDACNLSCKYCGYGELYSGYDRRDSKKLSYNSAILLIEYLLDIWKKNTHRSVNQIVYVSFYGGEPLLNMQLIEEIVTYIESLSDLDRKFVFSMTNNAMLLDKYMDYLAEKDVQLLISLDGDEFGNSYRVDQHGKNSFQRVFRNIKLLQEKYPNYFNKSVNINSVLHNRNSIVNTTKYIEGEFGKKNFMSPLNNTGILAEKRNEFEEMFQTKDDSIYSDIRSVEEYDQLVNSNFLQIPIVSQLMIFLFNYTNNVYRNYNDFFLDRTSAFPTGTCLPFSRKIFLTTNDKILVCERIHQNYVAGYISNNKVIINEEQLASQYNKYYAKFSKQCDVCYNSKACQQCIFQLDDLDEENVVCPSFIGQGEFENMKNLYLSFLRTYPEIYERIMKEVVLQ